MRLIGLTGGIGSGKSTVAAMFEELGCHLIEADQLGREVVKKGQPALDELVEVFGSGILTDEGELNRPEVAGIVFSDKQALAELNRITHRAMKKLQVNRIQSIYDESPETTLIYDAALIVEMGLLPMFQSVILVEAEQTVRLERLIKQRGFSLQDAQARIDSQMTKEEWRSIASVIINNSGETKETRKQVETAYQSIQSLPSLAFEQIEFPT